MYSFTYVNSRKDKLIQNDIECQKKQKKETKDFCKCWKQPKSPSVNEWIKKTMVCLHNGTLRRRKKKGAPTLCNSMDRTGENYAK